MVKHELVLRVYTYPWAKKVIYFFFPFSGLLTWSLLCIYFISSGTKIDIVLISCFAIGPAFFLNSFLFSQIVISAERREDGNLTLHLGSGLRVVIAPFRAELIPYSISNLLEFPGIGNHSEVLAFYKPEVHSIEIDSYFRVVLSALGVMIFFLHNNSRERLFFPVIGRFQSVALELAKTSNSKCP